MLESPAIEPGAIVIIALSNNLATTNDDTAVTIVQWRLGGLLEAKSQIVVGLHFAVSGLLCWA